MICELSVNREIKKNMTAFEYVKNANDPKWTLENYAAKVNTLYSQKLISKQKKKYLLMESSDIPDDFINRQKQDTAYISKRIIEELKKITPVITTTTGNITDWLRKEWGLLGILERMNYNRIIKFEKFIKAKFKESKIDMPENFSIIEKQIIKGDKEIDRCVSFTKRNDHRHHAIDALVVACTRQSYIQYLNTLNAQHDSTKIPKKYKGDKQAFLKDIAKPPKEIWSSFHNDAEIAINNIIVSVKDRKRLFTTSKNIIRKKNYTTNQYETIRIDSTNKAPRGKLHDETFYGSIKVPVVKYISNLSIETLANQYTDENQRAEFIKEANKHLIEEQDLQNIMKHYIKNKMLKRFEENNNDFKKSIKSIDENPINYSNKKQKKITLLYASVFEKQIVYRKGLSAYFVENGMSKTTILNKLKRVVDKGVRQLLLDFFESNKEWNIAEIKKHLNDPNGIIWFNEEMQIHIESIRIFNDKPDSKIPLYYNDSRKNPKRNTNLYIAPSNNYEYIVYEKLNKNGERTGKREFETVTMFDAVRGIKDSNSNNLKYLFSLQQNDTVYFPDIEENVFQTAFTNLNEIKHKLFTVAKFNQNGRIYFIPLAYADGITYLHIDDKDLKPIADEIKDIKKKAIQEEIRTDNAEIKNRCIKIDVDILGSKCVPYFKMND